jgi:hypothetical protein
MDTTQPARSTAQAHGAKARPDARPMRFALGAGGIATLSALAAAIVLPPSPAMVPTHAVQPAVNPQSQASGTRGSKAVPQLSATPLQVQRPIKYVQLSPGQTAPPGARVIDASAPTPISLVVTVAAPRQQPPAQQPPAAQPPTQQPPAPKPAPIATTQSGKVAP